MRYFTRFQCLMAVNVRIVSAGVMTPFILVGWNEYFRELYCVSVWCLFRRSKWLVPQK